MAAQPSSPGAAEVIRYHRRLDRTPEKQFHELPDTDKKLISQIRRATEKTVTSVGKLKDDIEERFVIRTVFLVDLLTEKSMCISHNSTAHEIEQL